jgi:hypothetical protein
LVCPVSTTGKVVPTRIPSPAPDTGVATATAVAAEIRIRAFLHGVFMGYRHPEIPNPKVLS